MTHINNHYTNILLSDLYYHNMIYLFEMTVLLPLGNHTNHKTEKPAVEGCALCGSNVKFATQIIQATVLCSIECVYTTFMHCIHV